MQAIEARRCRIRKSAGFSGPFPAALRFFSRAASENRTSRIFVPSACIKRAQIKGEDE